MATLFDCLAKWLAPIICFTAEEAWLARHGSGAEVSVHLETYPQLPSGWSNPALDEKWQRIRDLRRVVTGAIELERAAKRLGSSLQADVVVYAGANYAAAFAGLDLAEVCIVSGATLSEATAPADAFVSPDVPDVAVTVSLAAGDRCQRCWRILPEVEASASDLCERCADAVAHHRQEAAA